ncbi:hypothetical protein ACGFZP_24985 [Kitasatospora sp. NPDC048239]|uniref:hypothetical protein n=1 Tax=Kitasatospora sp. NPDC048239 TaxID=3364046 RepID=UPI00371DCF4D
MRTSALALTVLSAGLLATATGCSGASPASTPAPQKSVAAAPVAAATTAAPAPDAASVTRQLAAAGLPVRLTVTYDAGSDPNGKLGRPHQYTGKTAFDDTRVSSLEKAAADASKGRRDSISYGGTVEVFATSEDAQGWADYIDKAQQAMGGLMTPDYILRKGPVVVRVSHLLSAEQAKAYEAAL